jgi:hypothetical protein
MLGSVGDGGGAVTSAGSGVVLRTSMIFEEEANEREASRGELGITHCKREVFLNM